MSTKSETKPESMSTETKPESPSPSTSSIKTVSVDTEKTVSVDNVNIASIYETKNKLATDILALVANNDEFAKVVLNFNLKIDPSVLQNMLSIIKSLSHNSLNNIIDELNKIFADGKLEAYEVPKLLSVIISGLNNSRIKKIDHINVGYLIKCLLIILTHFNIIKLNNTSMNLLYIIIDDTIGLLDIPVRFSKKCCFFF
jgi:hypothetical protein